MLDQPDTPASAIACARAFRSSTSDFEEVQVAACQLETEDASLRVQSVGEIVQLQAQQNEDEAHSSDSEGERTCKCDLA